MSYIKTRKGIKRIHEKNKAKRSSSPSSKKKIRVNPGASFDPWLEHRRVSNADLGREYKATKKIHNDMKKNRDEIVRIKKSISTKRK